MAMETGPWTKSDPNLRFHKIKINKNWMSYAEEDDIEEGIDKFLTVDGSSSKSRQILVELTKHVGRLIRDNRQFFTIKDLSDGNGKNYSFDTNINPWGKNGPHAPGKHFFAIVRIDSWSSASYPEEEEDLSQERLYIGPNEWFNLESGYFDEVWDYFKGTVLFDYSDPGNIKIRTSWLEQAILKWRQEQQGRVPSLFTLAKQASDKYRLGLPTNTVRTTDTYKRKRDINDVQVTVQGYVF